MSLRIKRGTNSERLTIVPAEGELVYTTDTKQLFIGDGTTTGGNVATSSFQGVINDNVYINTHSIIGTGLTLNGGTGAVTSNTIKSNLVDSNNNIILDTTYRNNRIKLYNYNPDPSAGQNLGVNDPANIAHHNILPSLSSVRHYTSRGTFDSPNAVTTDDILFAYKFFGHNGTTYDHHSSAIFFIADGTVTNGYVPGRVAFSVRNAAGTDNIYYAMNSKGTFSAPKIRVSQTFTTSPDNRPTGTDRTTGTIIFETTTNTFQGWNGTTWVTLG